jgi:hypothetical protein
MCPYGQKKGRWLQMSLFGEHLRVLLDSNKVNIYGLAKSAGIERNGLVYNESDSPATL